MGLLDFLGLRRRDAAPRAAVQSSDGGRLITTAQELDDYIKGVGSASATGEVVTPDSALRVGAVYGCVRIIAGAVATLPLDIKQKVDERTRREATDHPLTRIFSRRPNQWMKPAQFRRMATSHILLRGNFYARIVRGSRGVTALLPLHPDRVEPRQRADLYLEYLYRGPNGVEQVFQHGDIFHITGMTGDGIKGMSVLSYAREVVGLAQATARHGGAFFRNGTSIGSVLKHKGKLGPDGLTFLQASLEAYRGSENAQRTLVLEEGMDFQALGMSAKDAEFVETMKLTRSDIAMFFGVPPHMLGDTEKSTSWGSGIEQQSLGFVAYTLEDWLTAWEDAINVDLVAESEADIYARFNRAALVRGDIKARWDAYTKGLQWGVISPDEVRALEDWNPRADGGGGIYYPPPNTAGATDEKPDEPARAS